MKKEKLQNNTPKRQMKDIKKSFAMLAKELKPNWYLIFFGIFCSIISTVFALCLPNLMKKIGEEIFSSVSLNISIDMQKILSIGIYLIVLCISSSIFSYFEGFCWSILTARSTKRFRERIVEKINKLPLKYFDNAKKGDILSRITNDVDTLGQTLNDNLSNMVYCITMVVGSLIMMFSFSWELTLITLVITPISLLLVILFVKSSQKYFVKQQKTLGEINSIIEENYTAHNVVKTYNLENKALEDFNKVNKKLNKCSFKSQIISGSMFPIMNFMTNLVYVIVCVVGGIMSIKNPIFAVTVVAFIQYMRMFNQQLGQGAQVVSQLQSAAAASERVFEFLNEKEIESDEEKTLVLENIKGLVEFKNVSFGYEKNKPIIKNFSAKILPGQKVAIVGPTGAGKTTLVNLLMRFYDIDSGEILIDGVNINDMSRSSLRALFGMVLQDAWIFDGTIRENISFGTNERTDEEIEHACCFAHIDHFIRSLPNGYNMMMDETASISQGQRQLLTIARAMVHNSPMLILDEATSNVDTRTEIMIQKAMDSLAKGRTSFVIAHRLSTIKNADQILVMKDGNIIEQGNHESLLKENGFYAELYNSQFND